MLYEARYLSGQITVALAAALAMPAMAEDKPSISELFKGSLTEDKAVEVTVAEVKYPPGFSSPRHYHTGRVLVHVLRGEGAMEVGGVVRTGGAGAVIEEEKGQAMVMSNPRHDSWLHFIVFQVGPAGEPMIVRTD